MSVRSRKKSSTTAAAAAIATTTAAPGPKEDYYGEGMALAAELGIDGDTVKEMRAVFEAWDRTHSGVVPLAEALVMLRACGERVSHTDLERANPASDGAVSFALFVRRIHRRLSRPAHSAAEQVRAALRCFERGDDGLASLDELRREQASTGEGFTAAELDALARDTHADRSGLFNSAAFAALLSSSK